MNNDDSTKQGGSSFAPTSPSVAPLQNAPIDSTKATSVAQSGAAGTSCHTGNNPQPSDRTSFNPTTPPVPIKPSQEGGGGEDGSFVSFANEQQTPPHQVPQLSDVSKGQAEVPEHPVVVDAARQGDRYELCVDTVERPEGVVNCVVAIYEANRRVKGAPWIGIILRLEITGSPKLPEIQEFVNDCLKPGFDKCGDTLGKIEQLPELWRFKFFETLIGPNRYIATDARFKQACEAVRLG
jgi:hypothetical protein